MRAVSRLADVSANTVSSCWSMPARRAPVHDEKVRNVTIKVVQGYEVSSFCYAKAKNIATAKAAPERAGDVWTWTDLDSQSKMILSSTRISTTPCS